jgi:glycosyltransferase involved in cell wall biosynthesis
MIVKNESHIIRGTLEMLCSKIRFDYWVICDTGSTDATREIIQEFFSEKNIKGELHRDEWVNFAHNRTKALEYAFNKTDFLLVFDADDELHGTIRIPEIVACDEYQFKFGMPKSGMSYVRTLLINNHKRFKYFSVLHEFISCQEQSANEQNRMCILEGDYYVVSGRSGSRNLDPDKYLKDANILASAHAEALAQGDDLHKRYSFYCANSYRDCGKHEDAIRWYKITLSQDNWAQEKYLSCLYIYQCYEAINQKEHGFYYLVKAFSHDAERVECFYPLLMHYCCEGMNELAYNYYRMVRMWPVNNDSKLFVETDKLGFFVPYYMIIVADRMGDRECGIRMYEIIFTQKHRTFSVWHLRNLMFNLSFFIGHVKAEDFNAFAALANSYVDFVINNGVPANTFDDLIKILNSHPKSKLSYSLQTKLKYKNSRNILFYTGYSNVHWNYSHMKRGALGGSEKAVAYLSKELGLLLGTEEGISYTIYVAGNVQAEELSEYNLKYVGLAELPDLLSKTEFHTVICSRYISFLEIYGPACSFYQFYIWAHDTRLLAYGYGCDLRDVTILEKWSDHIDGCVCQTKWHADEYANMYPTLKSKISIINNGIDLELFPQPQSHPQLQENSCKQRQPNKFIYTSRTERGLARILELWPQIVAALPDATLAISTYEVFPCNDDERRIQTLIESLNQAFPNDDGNELRIQHLGQLNPSQLYLEMSTAEYWLYPTDWPETSCITAMEMLMSEVICLYYPIAGLTNTMGECGVLVCPGTEIQSLMQIAHDEGAKEALRKQGRAYAESCAWVNRAAKWSKLLKLIEPNVCEELKRKKNESMLLFLPSWYNMLNLEDYIDSYRTIYKNVIISTTSAHAIDTISNDVSICTVIFGYEVSNNDVYNYCMNLIDTNRIFDVCILNTEPLNLTHRMQHTTTYLKNHSKLLACDYSLSNIKILNDNGIKHTRHMPYVIYDEEQKTLKMLNAQIEKTYDFGIVSPVDIVDRRQAVVTFLTEHGYTVKLISGFKLNRDVQIASCSVLLNIHGSLSNEESKIFEHIRCDRLLAAGYNILSEECLHLDSSITNAYARNLKLMPYSAFFVADEIASTFAALKSNSNSKN